MKGYLLFQKALPTVCVGRVFQLVEKLGDSASMDRCFTYIGKIPMLTNGLSRFDGLQDRAFALLHVPHLEDPKALHGHLLSVV